jgi:hypothetical protein
MNYLNKTFFCWNTWRQFKAEMISVEWLFFKFFTIRTFWVTGIAKGGSVEPSSEWEGKEKPKKWNSVFATFPHFLQVSVKSEIGHQPWKQVTLKAWHSFERGKEAIKCSLLNCTIQPLNHHCLKYLVDKKKNLILRKASQYRLSFGLESLSKIKVKFEQGYEIGYKVG